MISLVKATKNHLTHTKRPTNPQMAGRILTGLAG